MNNSTILIIPTYKESKNIYLLLTEILNLNIKLDILIIDDNSDDGTQEIVNKLSLVYPQISMLVRPRKLGLGSAYREAYKIALLKEYQYFIQMDADFSHQLTDLIKMYEIRKNFDLIIGSRYVQDGGTKGWSKKRLFLSKFANNFVKFRTKVNINDSTSGFRVYSRYALSKINFLSTNSEGYGFQIEMTYMARESSLDIIEVPITFIERNAGNSKMSKKIILEAFNLVLKLKKLK